MSGKLIYFSITFFLFTSCITDLYSQKDTAFWFACPNIVNYRDTTSLDSPIFLYVSAYDNMAVITINQPSGLLPTIIDTINPNSSKKINLSPWKNILENNPVGIVLNKGLKISSSALISLYYQVNPDGDNQESFVLKGKNALGTSFVIPMQNLFNNKDSTNTYNYSSKPKSSFYIVATEDSTDVTVTLKTIAVGFSTSPTLIKMNKGQTINIQNPSIAAVPSLGGSVVSSNKPIAITVAEDIADASAYYGIDCGEDLIGEQLVSINPIDTFYTVVKGLSKLQTPPAGGLPPDYEYLFITSTTNVNPTLIYVNGIYNQAIASNSIAQVPIHYVDSGAIKVSTNYPVYLYHNSGFGCQFASSLVPPTNCPGSTKINFMRYTSDSLFLLLNVKNGFQSSFRINGIPIPLNLFKFNKGNDSSWVYASVYLPISSYPKESTVSVNNTSMYFHMAVLQGSSSKGASLGYFSEFNKNYKITLSKSKDTFCEGNTINLFSDTLLGLNYKWTGPNSFVDSNQNPIILNAKPIQSGTYYLSSSFTNCSSRFDSIKVFIKAKCVIRDTIIKSICN
jgi:hypothetical protein